MLQQFLQFLQKDAPIREQPIAILPYSNWEQPNFEQIGGLNDPLGGRAAVYLWNR